MKKAQKTVLCIVDGLGINKNRAGNAAQAADMTNLWTAFRNFPSTTLVASGPEVGLVDPKDAGNSEVGHNAIGSGQRIKQGLSLLNDAFESGDIFTSQTWKDLVRNAASSKLNIITLLSDGRVHSDIEHLLRVLDRCRDEGLTVSIHALADGRDVPPQSVLKYMDRVNTFIAENKVNAKIATLAGRGTLFMDRYESNLRTMTDAFDVCVGGRAKVSTDIHTTITDVYNANPNITDESLPPFILDPAGLIQNGDSVLLLNYRGDRAIQTCAMFDFGRYLCPGDFSKIDKCYFAGILQYDSDLGIPKNFLCPPPRIENTLTGWLCNHNVRQFTVTETVKFGHMTYFFNGNRAMPIDKKLETWHEIKSDELGTAFNRAPAMKAPEITEVAINAIKSNQYDFIKLNLANPDMVGHTGDFDATVAACRVVDECLDRLIKTCIETNTTLIITSDHGNAEEMTDEKGGPKTSHTNNPVPLVIITAGGAPPVKIKDGIFGLTNLAATICILLGLPQSPHFREGLTV